MSEKPRDNEEPVEAELVEEDIVEAAEVRAESAAAQPPSAPVSPRPPHRTYRSSKKRSGFGKMLIILALVLVAAVLWRQELTDALDRALAWLSDTSGRTDAPPDDDVIVEGPSKPGPEPPKPQPKPEEPVEDQPLPTFNERTIPELPEEPFPRIPRAQRTPGLAYSIINRRDVGYERIFVYEIYIVVPADYKKDDLLRMALDVVAWERKQGLRHAIKFYCFKDKVNTKPEDAFAEVIWAPEGNFQRAREAVRAGPDNNEYRVIVK